jgi:hypothetical protein
VTWDRFASAILSIPLAWKWALAAAGVAIGLAFILRADGVIRGLRKWLLFQLRLVRRPGYRRMLKLYGWLLFVTGALLTILLLVTER